MNVRDKAPKAPTTAAEASLTYKGLTAELPVREGTIGPTVLDISRVHRDTGCFSYDPGFTSTANCASSITYIDGDKGELLYRGYPIEQLAENSNFLASCFLLLYGELPTNEQFRDFRKTISHHTMVHEQMTRFFTGFRRDAHPMAIMVAVVGALSAFYHDSTDINNPEHRVIATNRMIAKMPTIASMAYKYSIGQPFIYPRNDLDYTSNFLQMCFAIPCEPYIVNPIVARALDRIFILHADHEQNASTSVMRSIGSAGTDPYSSMAGATAALFGPRHGGANEAVLEQLAQIGDVKNVPDFVERAKKGEYRLMGFGHRVYKNYDPRAKIIKKIAYDVFNVTGSSPLIDIAVKLEEIALSDEYFVERKLYPNVDFYSGIIYKAMGFPPDMFTVLFALGRSPGWLAQWVELVNDKEQRISRPRQVYLGAETRDYVAIEQR